jgi:ribosomal protein S18 acetylase RimI-like enzyme
VKGDVRIRQASPRDASAVAQIGRAAMTAQYADLLDPEAVGAAVAQTYAIRAVADSIARCAAAEHAHFLVGERRGSVAGYLHFDSFGPEAELHRLYVDARVRGAGVGTLLMEDLHVRLPAPGRYMLLVVEGNDRAIAFYERHGLRVAELVDGLTYYRERMGVEFPVGTRSFRFALMRRG